MSLADLPILTMLKSKMRWHQARQNILAENVANADTPGFKGHDLKKATFESLLNPSPPMRVAAVRTNPVHLAGSPMTPSRTFADEHIAGWEVTPDGNDVVLEEQMMKVAENQMDYQMATTIYRRSLGLLRTAISGRG